MRAYRTPNVPSMSLLTTPRPLLLHLCKRYISQPSSHHLHDHLLLPPSTITLISPTSRLPYHTTSTRMAPPTTPTTKALSLDHLVLTVTNPAATISFYTTHLGMTHTTFHPPSSTTTTTSSNPPRHALTFGHQKINLHESGKEHEPKAQNVKPGSADLCFLVEDDVSVVLERLQGEGVEVLEGGGVVERTGARGRLRSVYIRDPDGNLVELSNLVSES